jgi:predicted RNA-binding protein YlxR (DUF448 family)
MARGGAADERQDEGTEGSLRRCIVSGALRPPEEMVRFVVGPDATVVPDVGRSLPGRGIWLSPARDVVNTAVAKKLFARAARARVTAPDDLADRVEALLARRCLEILGLARRAGQAVAGYEKVRARLSAGQAALLLEASDAAAGGQEKIRALAPDLPMIALFDAAALGAALGRDAAVHVAVSPGRLAERLVHEALRLAGFRSGWVELSGAPSRGFGAQAQGREQKRPNERSERP